MRMKRRQTQVSVKAGSRNVHADLGFPNPDAMLRKASIASEISANLKKSGLTQIAAARRIEVPQATFLRVMREEFTQVAEGTLNGVSEALGLERADSLSRQTFSTRDRCNRLLPAFGNCRRIRLQSIQ